MLSIFGSASHRGLAHYSHLLARVPSGVLASLALCLANDCVRDRPRSLESTPRSHWKHSLVPLVLGLGQPLAVGSSLRVKFRWLGPPPSTRVLLLFLRLLSRAFEAGNFTWPSFSHISLNLSTDLIIHSARVFQKKKKRFLQKGNGFAHSF